MEDSEDPYKILDVSHDATEQEIKKAYRKLALKHHPDKQKTDEEKEKSTVIFVKISNAYEILSNEEEREQYDIRQGLWKGKNRRTKTTSAAPFSSSPEDEDFCYSNHPSFFSNEKKKKTRKTNFQDPFSVFADVFQEEFGFGDDNDRRKKDRKSKKTTTKKSNNNDDEEEDGKEISMQMATKTIDGKSVTVTERKFEMPDGTIRTKVEKNVSQNDSKSSSRNNTTKIPKTKISNNGSSTTCPPVSSTTSKKKKKTTVPKTTVQIVNGKKETTITYPDGRSETKIEPLKQQQQQQQQPSTTRHVVIPSKRGDKLYPNNTIGSNRSPRQYNKENTINPLKTKKKTKIVKIVNGNKETTTTYPDGRTETKIEPVGSSSHRLRPTTTEKKIASSFPKEKKGKKKTDRTSMISNNDTNTSKSTKIQIKNGEKITTTTYATTMPNGTVSKRSETSIKPA